MPHHHLAFNLLRGFQRDAHHDHDGRAAQGQAVEAAELTEQGREQRDDTQDQGADQSHL